MGLGRKGAASAAREPASSAKAVSPLYDWRPMSTYIRRPPYWEGALAGERTLKGMRPLAILPDNITTDHLSPSNAILLDSAAGAYLPRVVKGDCPAGANADRSRKCPSHDPNCGCHGPIMSKGMVGWAGGSSGPDYFIYLGTGPATWLGTPPLGAAGRRLRLLWCCRLSWPYCL